MRSGPGWSRLDALGLDRPEAASERARSRWSRWSNLSGGRGEERDPPSPRLRPGAGLRLPAALPGVYRSSGVQGGEGKVALRPAGRSEPGPPGPPGPGPGRRGLDPVQPQMGETWTTTVRGWTSQELPPAAGLKPAPQIRGRRGSAGARCFGLVGGVNLRRTSRVAHTKSPRSRPVGCS